MTVVVIDRIAAGGDGVGRLEDGRTIFVPRTAPGDAVDVEITARKARYARGRVIRIISGSPMRVEPECPHYVTDSCGGCQLQHLSSEAQLEIKRRVVGDALRRIGGRETEDPRGVGSPGAWRYRTKLTLAVQGETIGLHREGEGESSSIFPLIDCLITAEPLMSLWERVRAHRAALPRELTSLVLRQDRDGGLHVVVVGGDQPWKGSALAAALGPKPVAVWWKPQGGATRVVAGERTGFPAMAFEQTNPTFAAAIRQDALAGLGEVSGRVVWDLYGGVGETARALANAGAKVWSVDADRSAIDWAEARGGDITYFAARVEDVLRKLPVPDAIVLNPPRTGLDGRASAYIERWAKATAAAPKRLAYVSCDPATLARDLSRMPSLKMLSVAAYDLFPQTAHVETLAMLETK